MSNGDLYPKGKKLWHKGIDSLVEYVCCAGNDTHIVLAEALDFLDDRVREARTEQLVDETVPTLAVLEARRVDPDCFDWIRRNQLRLYKSFQGVIGKMHERGYCLQEGDGGFMFYAIFQYQASRLKSQMAPGSSLRQ